MNLKFLPCLIVLLPTVSWQVRLLYLVAVPRRQIALAVACQILSHGQGHFLQLIKLPQSVAAIVAFYAAVLALAFEQVATESLL